MTEDNSGGDKKVFLSIDDTPVYFREDWNTGIGGGLWSTGLAIAKVSISTLPIVYLVS